MTEELWRRVLDDPAPPSLEATIGDCSTLFTHVRGAGGTPVYAFGADTTKFRTAERDLKESATELAEIARFPDMNPGPVIRADQEGYVLLANAAARKVFGKDVLGKCWRDLCPGLKAGAWDAILAAQEPVPVEWRVGECDYVFAHRSDPTSLSCSAARRVAAERRAGRGRERHRIPLAQRLSQPRERRRGRLRRNLSRLVSTPRLSTSSPR